eukprot:s689_g13.t4
MLALSKSADTGVMLVLVFCKAAGRELLVGTQRSLARVIWEPLHHGLKSRILFSECQRLCESVVQRALAGRAVWKLGSMAEPMRASFLQTVPDSLKVGARVEALGQFTGTVKFVGTTQFAAGPWIGVELDTPDGKNDGTIQGERYFDCKAGHGIFARPAAVRSLDTLSMPGQVPESSPASTPSAAAGPPSPDSSPGAVWSRRQSIDLDLRSDICVEDRVDLTGVLSGCADEVHSLHEAVDKLVQGSSASVQKVKSGSADQALDKLTPEEEEWLNKAAESLARSFEETDWHCPSSMVIPDSLNKQGPKADGSSGGGCRAIALSTGPGPFAVEATALIMNIWCPKSGHCFR